MKLYLVKSPESDDLPPHKDDSGDSATINLRSIAKGRSFENNYVRGRGWANRDKHSSGQWSDRNTWRQQWRHLVRRGRFWRGSIKPHLQHADLRPEAWGRRWIDSGWLVKSIDTSFKNAPGNTWWEVVLLEFEDTVGCWSGRLKGVYKFVSFCWGVYSALSLHRPWTLYLFTAWLHINVINYI